VPLDQREIVRPDGRAQAVGDGRDLFRGHDAAGPERTGGIIGARGFGGDHADAGAQGLGGHGGAAEQAAAADGAEDEVEVGVVLEQFDDGGALAGHDEKVVVGMHERGAGFRQDLRAGRLAGGGGGLAESDAVRPSARHCEPFDGRSWPHHDVGGDARKRAVRATAAAWLPEECVATPRAASVADRRRWRSPRRGP